MIIIIDYDYIIQTHSRRRPLDFELPFDEDERAICSWYCQA